MGNMGSLTGVYMVMATPFKKDGAIDYDGFGRNLDHYASVKVDGVMVAGALGEYLSMSPEERKALVEFAADRLAGRLPFMVGATAHRTGQVIDLCHHAREQGSAGVMILPPPGLGLLDDEIYAYYREVAENVRLPIMLYNNPGSSGMDMEFDLVKKLADLPNVCCIKEASGDIKRVARIRQELREDFEVFGGWEDMHYESFCAGARGWVCMGANYAPGLTKDIFDLFTTGDFKKAGELSKLYNPLARHMENAGKVSQTTKYIMDAVGLAGGFVRAPKQGLTADEMTAIDALLKNIKLY